MLMLNLAGHTCVVCKMRCNNPRAKRSCFGIHCEPCAKYHQIMHAIGMSHNCKACCNEERAHYDRHKEIAEHVMLISKIDLYGTAEGPQRVQLRLAGAEDDEEHVDIAEDFDQDDFDDTATEVSSIATPLKSPAAQKRLEKKAVKEAKALAKAQKNQGRFTIGPTRSDVAAVAKAIHGPTACMQLAIHTPGESFESIIDRNIHYVAAVHSSKRIYANDGVEVNGNRNERQRSLSMSDGMKRRIHDILSNLGISGFTTTTPLSPISPNVPSKFFLDGDTRRKRQAALNRVQTLIKEDIEKSDADERETLMRMAGYWRYVNKGIYNSMLVNHEHWEWATGAKVDRVSEDEDDAFAADVDDEDEETIANEEWEQAQEEAQKMELDDVPVGEADADLEAIFAAEECPLVNLAYSRFILMPENEAAYENIAMQQLEALAIAVAERDERRAAVQAAGERPREFVWKALA